MKTTRSSAAGSNHVGAWRGLSCPPKRAAPASQLPRQAFVAASAASFVLQAGLSLLLAPRCVGVGFHLGQLRSLLVSVAWARDAALRRALLSACAPALATWTRSEDEKDTTKLPQRCAG